MSELDYNEIWRETLNRLQSKLGKDEFEGWLADLQYLRAEKNSIVVGVSHVFHRDKLKSRYQNAINALFKDISGQDITIEFEVISTQPAENTPSIIEQPPKSDELTEKSKEYPHLTTNNTVTEVKKERKDRPPYLVEEHTFDNYIIGENNKFAANAAKAVGHNPGHAYNPLFIFGGVGLGKTHLMQAIGNYIFENSDNKVICVTSEDFLNEYTNSVREGKMNSFKNKFRYTDVLLIDDIQFIQGKEATQEELFHTFNALMVAKKQLVFTSDRPPSELKKFSERMLSRFEQSLKVDLQPPVYEVRCAILKSTAEIRNASIPDAVIDLIAKNISANIRDLIGALNTLIYYTELMGQPVTLEIAHRQLRDQIASPRHSNMSIENIIRVVAQYFNLTPNDLKGKKRTKNIVIPRQLAMYIARELSEYSTTELGQEFGGRDHTTVMHSIEKIKGQLLTDPKLESTIESLKRSVKEFISEN